MNLQRKMKYIKAYLKKILDKLTIILPNKIKPKII